MIAFIDPATSSFVFPDRFYWIDSARSRLWSRTQIGVNYPPRSFEAGLPLSGELRATSLADR